MNIQLSQQEYRDLLDILHIADVVMSGHRTEEDKRAHRHRVLIQKMYALAEGEGLGDMMSYDIGESKFLPTAEFEHKTLAHIVVREFEEHIFWDQLISRLSQRDAVQVTGGVDRLNSLSDTDRQHVEAPIRQRYVEEFTINGVANLEIIERFSTTPGLPAKTSD